MVNARGSADNQHHTFEVYIDGDALTLDVEGDVCTGADRLLLDEDDDLVAGTSWSKLGYTVQPFLDEAAHRRLRVGATELIREVVEQVLERRVPDLALDRYHEAIGDDERVHAAVIRRTREGWTHDRFPLDLRSVEARISEICGVPLTTEHWHFAAQRFYFRIVRPHRQDFNPPHRDVWLDFYRHGLNLFFPIAGCDERSSLPLVPGSHRWMESEIVRTADGARINGLQYHVPSVVGGSSELRMVRPNPGASEVLVFSPYLIHGGGKNLGARTRVSLEMRFWRWKSPSGS